MLEQISGSAALRFSGVPPQIIARDKATRAAVEAAQQHIAESYAADTATKASLREGLNAASAQRNALEDKLRREYPAYYALQNPKPITLVQLQHMLGRNEAMLAYDLLDKRSVVFVVSRDHFAVIPLADEKVLQASVARMRSHFESISNFARIANVNKFPADVITNYAARDLRNFAADSFSLYSQLIPPAVARLIAHKSLIITPCGLLYEIPWEALVTRAPRTRPHYLLEDHAVSYIPSGSLLAVVRGSEHGRFQREPLLAFARPAFGTLKGRSELRDDYAKLQYDALSKAVHGQLYTDLPGSEIEANAVRVALKAGPQSVLSGEDATKAKLLALNDSKQLQRYRYLLFATHAVLPGVSGLTKPALVLAHPENDGFVTIDDILGLALDADFVELSACNTGLGIRDVGDGVNGMTRAFLYAGARAISVTLWEIDDQAAPMITPSFFAAMDSGMPATAAFRRAKLALLASQDLRFRHPYAWAGSVIFGDGAVSRK